ncbi:hypothetical protein [Nocardia altamirensis]|uniref:hypothetical protein n=1 Tax=Nocardia altamirensis TaxID=472158 RepID=UPI0008402798|nr:hypothetical protein [Nocardia altamirensis]
MTAETFRTFCHINEYGIDGFEKLHRMVATSSPLVLWGPSSRMIASIHCRIQPHNFLGLVDSGDIKIICREWWLDRASRDRHDWSGAKWTPGFDDALAKFATEDSPLPEEQRRVSIISGEGGDTWAPEYVERSPELADAIFRSLTASDAHLRYPRGVVEKADRHRADRRKFVATVVRDTYNHDAALADSGTKTPFLLAPKESAFQQLLEHVRAESPVEFPEYPRVPSMTPSELAALTAEVLQVLRHLEDGRSTSVRQFMKHDGQQLIAAWMNQFCHDLEQAGGRFKAGDVVARLRRDFDNNVAEPAGEIETPEVVGRIAELTLDAADMVGSDQLLQVFGGFGIAASALPLGTELARRVGLLPKRYEGPCKWAFAYAYGKVTASNARRRELRHTFDRLT